MEQQYLFVVVFSVIFSPWKIKIKKNSKFTDSKRKKRNKKKIQILLWKVKVFEWRKCFKYNDCFS